MDLWPGDGVRAEGLIHGFEPRKIGTTEGGKEGGRGRLRRKTGARNVCAAEKYNAQLPEAASRYMQTPARSGAGRSAETARRKICNGKNDARYMTNITGHGA